MVRKVATRRVKKSVREIKIYYILMKALIYTRTFKSHVLNISAKLKFTY